MNERKSILVAYPRDFCCYSKLKRKVEFYTSQTESIDLVCFEDANEFVQRYAEEKGCKYQIYPTKSEAIYNATHAIIFEDRNCYGDVLALLKSATKPTRIVRLQLTLVVNKDRGAPYDIYIGRGSMWGNPYQMGQDGDRDEVIRKFEYDFKRGFLKASENFDQNISLLKGKVIACHCKPAACHGDIIANYINSIDDGE